MIVKAKLLIQNVEMIFFLVTIVWYVKAYSIANQRSETIMIVITKDIEYDMWMKTEIVFKTVVFVNCFCWQTHKTKVNKMANESARDNAPIKK